MNHETTCGVTLGHYKGPQNYGTDVVFILTLSEQSNPEGFVCMDRNP